MTEEKDCQPCSEKVSLYSGRCRGGPYNTKQLHHGEDKYRVAVDAADPKRVYPGQVAPSQFAPDIRFGVYFHRDGEWHWNDLGKIVSSQRPPETTQAVDNETTAEAPADQGSLPL